MKVAHTDERSYLQPETPDERNSLGTIASVLHILPDSRAWWTDHPLEYPNGVGLDDPLTTDAARILVVKW